MPWKEPGKAQQAIDGHNQGNSPSEDRFGLHGLLAGLWADDMATTVSSVVELGDDFVTQAVASGLARPGPAWQEPSGGVEAVPAAKTSMSRPERTRSGR
ncbi:hypothetical protein ACQEU8_00485 [Streptomyces sp. CA-250714]|uniref:hypothetical protein n=1 Tax=Streptomyces sp. CA-250714 TaxID=3240060 RepID=UPI003D9317E7